MDLLAIAQWCEGSGLGTWIRETTWAFAVIEATHLLALSVIGGAVLVVDLRLLGIGLKNHPVNELAQDAQRWQNRSLLVLLITGLGLFLSESVKCYYSAPFWFKMISLILAILFTYTVRRRVIFAPEGRFAPSLASLVAIVSMALWLSVGAGGRWIGFSG